MAVRARFNKWSKYKFMRNAAGLVPHLPATSPMSERSFGEMSERYGRVVVKPVGGMQGQGIFHVSCLPDGRYEVQHENRRIKLAGRRKTYAFLSKQIGSQSYIVQQSIDRATVGERAFDLRIIVQRKKIRAAGLLPGAWRKSWAAAISFRTHPEKASSCFWTKRSADLRFTGCPGKRCRNGSMGSLSHARRR